MRLKIIRYYLQLSMIVLQVLALSTYVREDDSSTKRYEEVIVSGNEPGFGNLQDLYSKIDPEIQAKTAQAAVERIIGERHAEISIRVDRSLTKSPLKDAFSITQNVSNGKIEITGTTGVAAIYGLNDYLKYHCKCHISWEGSQLVTLPNPLPNVTYKRDILDRFRYYQNVCTDSYAFVWWGWQRWEKEIDWMALNGINMPLAFTGQEAIWQRVYLSLGLSPDDISDYISGPAFLAWWRMGNVQKWGGPMPQHYIDKKLVLLHKILNRMRSFGMLPVLPAFAGNVPLALKKLYPNITLIQHPSWNGFNSSYATYMLEPSDRMFHRIGLRFIEELTDEVGTDHIYSCDTFNENTPSNSSSEFLQNSARSTYEGMSAVDPKAVWLMQSWVFQSEFWQNPQVEAYLSGVDKGNALILDLEAERRPLYKKFNNFFGHSFIWCMLQNYGGTMNLYGAFDLVNNGISFARENVTSGEFAGIGSCPEGINQNSVMFDFLHEMSLHPSNISVLQWTQAYAERRYGEKNDALQNAWEILQKNIYNAPPEISNHGKSIITKRPSLKLTEDMWYPFDDIEHVNNQFIKASKTSKLLHNNTLFLHDLVDIIRQFLVNLGGISYDRMMKFYNIKSQDNFEKYSTILRSALSHLDKVLESSPDFLLGNWVQDAQIWGIDKEEKALLRYNALNQITLWGPSGEIVDYAAKQWAGTVKDYYLPRWNMFISALNESLVSGKPFNSKQFRKDVLMNVEIPFTNSQTEFSVVPKGNTIVAAKRIYRLWKKVYKKILKESNHRILIQNLKNYTTIVIQS